MSDERIIGFDRGNGEFEVLGAFKTADLNPLVVGLMEMKLIEGYSIAMGFPVTVRHGSILPHTI